MMVTYASKHGATEGIAHHIARSLSEAGKEAEARSVMDVDDLGEPEAVVVGSAFLRRLVAEGGGRVRRRTRRGARPPPRVDLQQRSPRRAGRR